MKSEQDWVEWYGKEHHTYYSPIGDGYGWLCGLIRAVRREQWSHDAKIVTDRISCEHDPARFCEGYGCSTLRELAQAILNQETTHDPARR